LITAMMANAPGGHSRRPSRSVCAWVTSDTIGRPAWPAAQARPSRRAAPAAEG